MTWFIFYNSTYGSSRSGGSRISRRGGMDLRCGHFSLKMYAKMKELGPVGGSCAPGTPPPPRSANVTAASQEMNDLKINS